MKIKKLSERSIAIGAIRSEARRQKRDPNLLSAGVALLMLDDLARSSPELVASQWYKAATDRQIRLFAREWKTWCEYDRIERLNAAAL